MRPVTYTYKQRPNAEYQRFSEEYFAGSDIRIYFGDIWVDEITSLQFSLIENVAPIFGYASYTYDEVATGSRHIQGSFRINFKESYYLHSVINSIEWKMKERARDYRANPKRGTWKNPVTVEHLLSTASTKSNKEFDELAYEFEKSLWYRSSNRQMTKRTNERGETSYFFPETYDLPDDDIMKRGLLQKTGFNILILYGPYTEAVRNRNMPVSTTAHTLTGVHLTGVQQIIDGSGQPIQEEYTFIAKDLDGNINSLEPFST